LFRRRRRKNPHNLNCLRGGFLVFFRYGQEAERWAGTGQPFIPKGGDSPLQKTWRKRHCTHTTHLQIDEPTAQDELSLGALGSQPEPARAIQQVQTKEERSGERGGVKRGLKKR
jgi:hypothetical protein